jgi:hypothetical protein
VRTIHRIVRTGVLVVLASFVFTACAACSEEPPGDDDNQADKTFDECDGDPASFVRQAFLALDGRRPLGQAEVDVYVDLFADAQAQEADPYDVVARAIMSRPSFNDRWLEAFMDSLRVQRLDFQTEAGCWDTARRTTVTGALAQAVRDMPATGSADGQTFTMLDLAKSSLVLDDITPIYRGQLFSMVSHPLIAANVGRVDAELARRADFGSTFDSSYIHRDVVCLGCHNSEGSVTDRDDPALDRHWPVPGNAERAVYGSPNGVAIERAHAAFRVDSFVDDGNEIPWGWSGNACGSFRTPTQVQPDTLTGVDGKLGSLTGNRTTVFDLEQALARGFAALEAGAPTGDITDPDTALAWLVTLKITEDVWTHATGTRLTIANYFARNQASSDLLYSLASTLATSGYSLKALLVAIVKSDFFNRQAPDQACGPNPYTYPNVFDPWTTADADPERQGNGPGDAVTAIDGRLLLAVTSAALEWQPPPAVTRFPDYGEPGCESDTCQDLSQACNGQFGACCTTFEAACQMGGVLPADELPFLRGIGVFLRNSERGFRGLDFQARLAWEDRNGACDRPSWQAEDFIDRLAAAGAADSTATAADVVAALKDRLIGEPVIEEGAEAEALSAIVGALENPASGVTADMLRQVCGALVGSPQFLLQGIAGRGGDRPKLTPANADYGAVCADLAATGIGVPGLAVSCGDTATLVAARIAPVTHQRAPATPEPAVKRKGKPDPRRIPAPTRMR